MNKYDKCILDTYMEVANKGNKQKQLWEKLAKKNAKYYINSDYGKGINNDKFRESGWNDFVRLIESDELIEKNQSILEIGCGTGRMTEFMPRFFNYVVGTDISGEMIKQAKHRIAGIDFIETDGYTLPLDDNYFDIVFSYLVFQHMKTKEMVKSNFKEVFRVLKPGGIFKVRLRIDQVDNMNKWWAGVTYTEKEAIALSEHIGFGVIKTEQVEDYGVWLWLIKKNC